MAKMEFPDYKELYFEQCAYTKKIQEDNDNLHTCLRDEFAVAALTGIVAAQEDALAHLTAKRAYGLADAMLEARNGKYK